VIIWIINQLIYCTEKQIETRNFGQSPV